MPASPTAFSVALEAHRARQGMSVRVLTRSLYERGFDYSEAAVRSWFRNDRMPPVGVIAVLCDLFELDDAERVALLRAAAPVPAKTTPPARPRARQTA